jgi:hypothetical protein
MTLPANIRVNTQVPFPALVTGSGPITVAKKGAIWIVGFAAQLLGLQNPPVNLANDQAVVWDPIAKQLILTPLTGLIITTAKLQRSIANAGNLPIIAADAILNFSAVTDLVPVVPLAATRNGAPLTFKSVAGSHLQTITRTAPDTFDGYNSLPLAAGTSLTLMPYNDGVNSGWGVV